MEGSKTGKRNALLNLINNQPGEIQKIFKLYFYAKDPYEVKYQFFISKRQSTELKDFNDPKAFTEYSNGMQDVYKNFEEYNIGKKRKTPMMIWLLI